MSKLTYKNDLQHKLIRNNFKNQMLIITCLVLFYYLLKKERALYLGLKNRFCLTKSTLSFMYVNKLLIKKGIKWKAIRKGWKCDAQICREDRFFFHSILLLRKTIQTMMMQIVKERKFTHSVYIMDAALCSNSRIPLMVFDYGGTPQINHPS